MKTKDKKQTAQVKPVQHVEPVVPAKQSSGDKSFDELVDLFLKKVVSPAK